VQIVFFVASRGHHADVGGITPGSMPPTSRRLVEEGAAVISFKLVRNGAFQARAAYLKPHQTLDLNRTTLSICCKTLNLGRPDAEPDARSEPDFCPAIYYAGEACSCLRQDLLGEVLSCESCLRRDFGL